METATSFDLNRAISQWREHLAQSPAVTRESVDELESHLRDSMATLLDHGLSEDEAFAVAAGRLGDTSVLRTEFGKVNVRAVWIDRVFWMLVGIQAWATLAGSVRSIVNSAIVSMLGSHPALLGNKTLTVTAFTAVYLIVAVACLATCRWIAIGKRGRFVARLQRWSQHRAAWVLACAVLCAISLIGAAIKSIFMYLAQQQHSFSIIAEPLAISQGIGGTLCVFAMLVAISLMGMRRLRAAP